MKKTSSGGDRAAERKAAGAAAGRAAKTVVGAIDPDVLSFTVGLDPILDRRLAEWDCYGTAAHATMLARMRYKPRIFSGADLRDVLRELSRLRDLARAGALEITEEDQDCHLAIERNLTEKLGDLGKRVHTGRSRNDQSATAIRLFLRDELFGARREVLELADVLAAFGRRNRDLPMVGRTHLQPAMPSSVGVWAGAWAEELLRDDLPILETACTLVDCCPLGSAASYGVPLPIDRVLTARLLGFREPVRNVLAAGNSRGKIEAETIAALAQTMLTLSRLAEDLILFSMPEFGYFALPREFCTGSSIMPQKYNPDVCELLRSKAAQVCGLSAAVNTALCAMPGGYNRDLQDTKKMVMDAMDATRSSLRIMAKLVGGLRTDPGRLRAAFAEPGVFATDRALELVAGGMPFRDAYHAVRDHLEDLRGMDPDAAIARKTHLGAPADPTLFDWTNEALAAGRARLRGDRSRVERALRALLPHGIRQAGATSGATTPSRDSRSGRIGAKGAVALAIAAIVAVVAGLGVSARSGSGSSAVVFSTEPAAIADVVSTIAASGTLEPEELVDVGAQVSGKIVAFGTDAAGGEVDYCSDVTNGMVLARIDDVTYLADLDVARAQMANAEAAVASAKAGLRKAQVDLEHARKDWARAQAIGVGPALSQSDFDSYQAAFESAEAQEGVAAAAISQAQAQVVQSRASVEKAERNLGYCTIISPVDGVVVDRRVNLGQTVVSSMSASSLFLVARDLRKMRIWASVNEADVGAVKPGQPVSFTVDTLPGRSFRGSVRKVRLNATLTSNVVTYTVEIDVDNADLSLMPYLTASVEFETDSVSGSLAVPSRALRWSPDAALASTAPKTNPGQGVVWVLDRKADGRAPERGAPPTPRPVVVDVRLNNGAFAAVSPVGGGALAPGDEVVVRAEAASDAGAGGASGGANNPFLPKLPRPPKRGP